MRPRLPGLNAPSGVRWTVSGMGEEDSERVEKQRGGGLEGRSGDNRGGGIIYERGVGVGRGRVCRGVEWLGGSGGGQ